MGVMGLPMAKNVVQKCGLPVLGYDVVQQQMDAFREAGGIPVSDPAEIYKACDVILQILPTHPIIRNSVEQAIQYGKPGNVIVDLSSTAPDIILELYQQAKDAGMFLLDSPVSGGNPMAIAGTLAIMTGGDKEAFDKVKPVLACMGSPVYTGGPASGSVTKLVNNMIGGAILVAIAEGYAFAAKAGIDLQTTFEATRGGFAGGPMYDNKVPKIIKRDYTPGARIAVHRKDILNAKHYAHKLDIDTLYIEDVHRRDRLAAHHLLTDTQLGGLQVAADDAGIGAQALHKGVPGAFEHRLVAGRADGSLFLGAHVEGEHRGFPGKEEQTAAVHQIKHRRVQPGTLLRAQVVEGPVLHAVHGLPGSPAAGQRLVLGQRPEHVVADPLHLHHAAEVAQGERARAALPQGHRTLGEVHAVLEDLLQPFQGQRPVKAGLLPGMGYAGGTLPTKKAHGAHLLLSILLNRTFLGWPVFARLYKFKRTSCNFPGMLIYFIKTTKFNR